MSNKEPSDIFSVGLVFFFVLSGGEHALGNTNQERSTRMDSLKQRKSTAPIRDRLRVLCKRAGPAAADVVNAMLQPEKERRPTALQVLEHPLFWNAEERLKLIDDVKEAFGGASQLRNAIDERPVPGQRTIDGWDYKKHWWFRNSRDWRLKNGIAAKVFWDASPVRGEAVKFVHPTGSRLYGHRVSDLVFFIRNLRRHFGDQRAEVQRAIRGDDGGDAAASPEHMLDRYFGRLFPSLVVYLWRTKAKVSAGSAK